MTYAEQIILTQEWIESEDSKTGWIGLGWNEPKDYEINEVLEYDKFYNPVLASFSRKND